MNMDNKVQDQHQNRCSLLDFNGTRREYIEKGYSNVKMDDTFTLESARQSRDNFDDPEGFNTNRSSSSNSI